MSRLRSKTAVITGAANGIGLEAARTFKREGANVVIADFNEEAGKKAEEANPGVVLSGWMFRTGKVLTALSKRSPTDSEPSIFSSIMRASQEIQCSQK